MFGPEFSRVEAPVISNCINILQRLIIDFSVCVKILIFVPNYQNYQQSVKHLIWFSSLILFTFSFVSLKITIFKTLKLFLYKGWELHKTIKIISNWTFSYEMYLVSENSYICVGQILENKERARDRKLYNNQR